MASRGCKWRSAGFAASLAGLAVMTAGPAAAEEKTPSIEEMWQIIKSQQQEIDRLKKGNPSSHDEVVSGGATDEAAADAGTDMVEGDVPIDTHGGAGWWERTSIGGYGEMHYNAGGTDEIDFHRYVLYVGHEFSERVRLFSELELEHSLAGDGEPGEVELEQAWIEIDLFQAGRCGVNADIDGVDPDAPVMGVFATPPGCPDIGTHSLRAGLMLIPVGILNETHEPPTFYGVERNSVETNIIPTTWWEGGAGLHGFIGNTGFSYDALFHSGLSTPTTGSNAFRIRNGRQKVAEATAKDSALTGRLKYTGIPGVELAATVHHQFDIAQRPQGMIGVTNPVEATLYEAHTDIKREVFQNVTFGLRALYARWELSGGDPGLNPTLLGRDLQEGWYVEPSLRFVIGEHWGDIGFFFRHSEWDNGAGDSIPSQFSQYTYGFNYWPHPNVVFKLDYQDDYHDDITLEDDRLNLGLGFQF